eukprot:13693314-Alexandrium_andersonii.AAC.1
MRNLRPAYPEPCDDVMPVWDAARPKALEWLRMALGMREVPRFALKVLCFNNRSTSTRGFSVGRNRRAKC